MSGGVGVERGGTERERGERCRGERLRGGEGVFWSIGQWNFLSLYRERV